MKIALVTDTYHPQVNGIVSSIETIRGELEEEHEVHIFGPTGDDGERSHSFPSLTFYPRPGYQISFVRGNTLANLFEEEEIDVVHVHTPFSLGIAGVIAARKIAAPSVGTFHTLLPEYTRYISRSLGVLLKEASWKFMSWFYGLFDTVTTPSGSIKGILEERGMKNVHVIPNAVDVEKFRPSRRSSSGGSTVLFVGRLGREKSLEVLIEAAPPVLQKHPETEFRIIGEGVDSDLYAELVREKGLSDYFKFEGYVSRPELVAAYQSSDVFAMPSETETQGLAALEAMACGTPVVGAEAHGLKDVIDHGKDGYLFQAGDAGELAGYMLKILEDDRRKGRMGRRARRKAEKFSSERVEKLWLKLYSFLLSHYDGTSAQT